ncbi:unnamed protein product [Schistosoma haematobium]|nr:unnamed protein product [Schistosoma haematobium]
MSDPMSGEVSFLIIYIHNVSVPKCRVSMKEKRDCHNLRLVISGCFLLLIFINGLKKSRDVKLVTKYIATCSR